MSTHPVIRMLRTYAWRHRKSYALGTLCLGLTNWLTVKVPIELGAAIDLLRAGTPGVADHARNIAVMGFAIVVVRTLSRVLFFNPGRDVEYALRLDLFKRLVQLQPSFFATRRTGDIVSRASNDIGFTRALVGFAMLQAVNVLMAVGLAGTAMVQLSARLTLFSLLPVALGLFVVRWGIQQMFSLTLRNQAEMGAISDHVMGSFQGVATIQGFVAEDAFKERFAAKNGAWFKTSMRLAVVQSLAFPMLMLAGGASLFVLLFVGGPMTFSGELSVGDLAAYIALFGVLLPPLRSLGWMLSVWQRGHAALTRIFELLDAPVERPEGPSPLDLSGGHGPALSLRGLTFAYPDAPERPALADVSAEIPAGAMVGLFGRTGSGKSTLVKVLTRLYNPPPGTVFVDGTDITRLDLDLWRDRLSVVPQRPFLFSESIARNVGLDLRPDDERVARAVSRAALDIDLSALPDGLDTVVGERGIMLSGGQRQRVALARGLYRRGDLLILDDVLSAVDHATEADLVDTLGQLGAQGNAPTTLIVSHRLSAFRNTSLILVMDEGRLVDQGTHAELVERPGLYRDTWFIQREGTDEADGVPGGTP